MPRRRPRGQSAGVPSAKVWGAILVVAATTALSACSGSGYQYVKSSGDRTYFKVPSDWKLYDNDALLEARETDLSDAEIEERRANTWATVFDGHPAPALAHLANRSPQHPVGQAIVQKLSPEAADGVSLSSLRNLFFEIDKKLDKETAEVLAYEPVERDGGFHGSRMVARITTNRGDVVVNQIVLLDQAISKVYALAVSCSTECYDEYESDIDTVVDSWTVKDG